MDGQRRSLARAAVVENVTVNDAVLDEDSQWWRDSFVIL
jgi:hypothetical protein